MTVPRLLPAVPVPFRGDVALDGPGLGPRDLSVFGPERVHAHVGATSGHQAEAQFDAITTAVEELC